MGVRRAEAQSLDVESASPGLRTLDTKSAKSKKAPSSAPDGLSSLLVFFVLGVTELGARAGTDSSVPPPPRLPCRQCLTL